METQKVEKKQPQQAEFLNKIYHEKDVEEEVKQRAKLDAVAALREAHSYRAP